MPEPLVICHQKLFWLGSSKDEISREKNGSNQQKTEFLPPFVCVWHKGGFGGEDYSMGVIRKFLCSSQKKSPKISKNDPSDRDQHILFESINRSVTFRQMATFGRVSRLTQKRQVGMGNCPKGTGNSRAVFGDSIRFDGLN